MEIKFPELCNTNILVIRFISILQKEIELASSAKEAHAHGESPRVGEMLNNISGKQIGIEEIIDDLPLWGHLVSAFLSLLADNNRRLLEAMSDLTSDEFHA